MLVYGFFSSYIALIMGLLILLLVAIAAILLTRVFGAWMLRINEVIDLLKEISNKLSR